MLPVDRQGTHRAAQFVRGHGDKLVLQPFGLAQRGHIFVYHQRERLVVRYGVGVGPAIGGHRMLPRVGIQRYGIHEHGQRRAIAMAHHLLLMERGSLRAECAQGCQFVSGEGTS